MAQYSRLTVYTQMIQTGLVPLFFHDNVDEAERAIQALLEGGVRCVEFTNRGDQAHLVFEQLAQRFRTDDRLILGVGTVLDPGTAAHFMQLGASFIVSPIFDEETARVCNRRGKAFIPGTATTTEIARAMEMGAEICKIFPGSQLGGPGFIKAVRGPLPWVRLMPTGGVSPTQENVQGWIEAGAAGMGIGSNLINKQVFSRGDYASLRDTVAQVLAWIQAARSRIQYQL